MSSHTDNRRLLIFVGLGLLLHTPLLLWQWRPPVSPAPRAISVELLPSPPLAETAPVIVEPPPPIEPDQPPEPVPDPSPSEPSVAPEEPIPEPVVEPPPEPQAEPSMPSPEQIREQIRVLAREPASDESESDNLIERKYTAFVPNGIPALPSDPGEGVLGQYMMLAAPIVKQYRDVDGFDRVEVTMRDGTIMCGARPRNNFMPDAIADSTNIFTWHVCRDGFTGRK